MPKDGRSGPLSHPDLAFLGYTDVHRHRPADLGLRDRCRVFDGTVEAGVAQPRHWFVYLLADATNADIQDAARGISGPPFDKEDVFVVIPKSLQGRRAIQDNFDAKKLRIFEDLMWERIRREFRPYMANLGAHLLDLKAGIPYIEPVMARQGNDGEIQPIKHFLDFFSGDADGGIAVVKADAGFGKTTLAVMVADELVQQWEKLRIIPLLFTGKASWPELATSSHSAGGLWELLNRALELQDLRFPLSEETIFTRILRQGYIAFIFDGFDEIRQSDLTPLANFAWIGGISENSNAHVMVTARNSFWDREIGVAAEIPHQVLDLRPFDDNCAREYFRKAFNRDENRVREGMQIRRDLTSSPTHLHFVELPSCAAMIADQITKGASRPIRVGGSNGGGVIDRFFNDILDRERARQGISLDVQSTKHILSEVATSYSNGFPLDVIADLADEFPEVELEALRDHAFLAPMSKDAENLYQFRHEFLFHYFRTYRLRSILELGYQGFLKEFRADRELRNLIYAEADGRGQVSDQLAALSDELAMERYTKLHQLETKTVPEGDHGFKSFLFHVIAKVVALRDPGQSRADRCQTTFALLGATGRSVSRLSIEGPVVGMSFKGWTVKQSRFKDLALGSSDANELCFSGCRFLGELELQPGHTPMFEGCSGQDGAELVIDRLRRSAEDPSTITAEKVRDHLKYVLRSRFRPRNHFRTVHLSEWKTGRTKAIEESYDLLRHLREEGLVIEELHQRLRVAPAEIGNVRDFVDNGVMRGNVVAVYDRILNTLKLHSSVS